MVLRLIISYFLFCPFFLFGQIKKPVNKKPVNVEPNGQRFVEIGNSQLLKGDTINGCLNFMIAKGMGFYKPNLYYEKTNYRDDVELNCYDNQKLIKKEIRNNPAFKKLNYPPLEFVLAQVVYDDESVVLKISLHNNSSEIVDGFECRLKFYDINNKGVNGIYGTNNGFYNNYEEDIYPGDDGGFAAPNTYFFHQGITKIRVSLVKVRFRNGGFWKPKPGQEVFVYATLAKEDME